MKWDRKWLFDFSAEKTQLVSFDQSNNTGVIDVEMDGSLYKKKASFDMPGLIFSFNLDWGSYIVSFVKTSTKKIGALVCSTKFLSPEVAMYLYKFTIQPCIEYFCHVSTAAFNCYLELLDKLQKRICRAVDASLAGSLEPLAQGRNSSSLSHFYKH